MSDGTATASAVRAGRLTARAATEALLARIAAAEPKVNAFTDVTAARALAEADAVDQRLASGADLPLAGVGFAVKNLFDLRGLPTRAGAKINRDLPPAPRDATLVERLTAAGAICLGALNMGEYAYDFTGENAHDGICRNPHDLGRMSGGSSSGSGAAVAAGMVPIALGSDTNGSIRVPSSFCGTFGLKPTYGRLSRARSFPFTHSLDHLGPFARSVRDLALVYDLMQGTDSDDVAQEPRPVEPTLAAIERDIGDLRIAVAGGWFREQGDPLVHAAVDRAAAALGARGMVTIPEAARARAAAYLITNAESSTLHLSRLKARAADFDPDTRDRFLAGTMLPAGWYVAAQRFRGWFRAAMNTVFSEVDVILAPSTPFQALRSGQKTITLAGEEMLARPNIGVFTQPISFGGFPVAAVPISGAPGDMPTGLQVIAAPWREDRALAVAAALERAGIAAAPVASGL